MIDGNVPEELSEDLLLGELGESDIDSSLIEKLEQLLPEGSAAKEFLLNDANTRKVFLLAQKEKDSLLQDTLLKEEAIEWYDASLSPFETVLTRNIRPIDMGTVLNLATNFLKHKQLQNCLGDFVELEDGTKLVRIIAGQHRYYAALLLRFMGYEFDLTAKISNRTLTDEEILSIQMSENLHNTMTPAQDAAVIHSFWEETKRLYGDSRRSLAYVAAKLGRSKEKVRDALRYIEELHPVVQSLVDRNALSYSTALRLTQFKKGAEDVASSEQIRYALSIVEKKLNTKNSEKWLKGREDLKKAISFGAEPLFNLESFDSTTLEGLIVRMKKSTSNEGLAAMKQLERIMKSISSIDRKSKLRFSDAIKNTLKELNISIEDFFNFLSENDIKFS
ncbi:MAG: ParB/RepB/Spo0J family partition protein [Candidatus Dojkabacteria bacterium]